MNTCIFILTLNEENVVQQSLGSALATGLPTFLLDSGSVDATKNIALELGVQVYEHHQTGEYSAAVQRNFALKIARDKGYRRVFFLDADEIIPPSSRNKVGAILEKYSDYDVISVPLRYYLYGKFVRSHGYPNFHDRIITVDSLFRASVGEHIATKNKVYLDELYLIHFFNSRGMASLISKTARYAHYIGEEIFKYRRGENSEYFGKEDGNGPLKRFAARFLWARPFLRFGWNYFWKRGFLEGRSGLVMALHNAHLEYMIVIRVIELQRLADGKDL